MTDSATPLAAARAALTAAEGGPAEERARLAYYQALAAAELILLLTAEPDGDDLSPKLFDLDDGPALLAFAEEEGLAELSDEPLPYAALPGRVILSLIAGKGLALGIDLTDNARAYLMPPDAVDWLAWRLTAEMAEGGVGSFSALPPGSADQASRLGTALAAAAPMAARAWLVTATAPDGRRTPALVFEDPAPGTEAALTRAGAEALALSGLVEGAASVLCLPAAAVAEAGIAGVGLPIDLPRVAPPTAAPERPAPGSDPDRPPKLR